MPPTRQPQIPAQILDLDSLDPEPEPEPQFSGDEYSTSDNPGSASTLILSSSDVNPEFQSSPQLSSAQSSIASTLVVPLSADDPEAHPSIQSSGDGGDSIASRMKLRRTRRREQHSHTPIMNTDPNDPPSTPQLTNDNPLIGSQDRQRAPLKQLRRCLRTNTRNDSSMSETIDETVDYGSLVIDAFPYTDSVK